MALALKLFSRFAAGCEPLFGRYLLATNTVSSGVLMGLGDVIIQKLEKVKSKEAAAQHDWLRTGTISVQTSLNSIYDLRFVQNKNERQSACLQKWVVKSLFSDKDLEISKKKNQRNYVFFRSCSFTHCLRISLSGSKQPVSSASPQLPVGINVYNPSGHYSW